MFFSASFDKEITEGCSEYRKLVLGQEEDDKLKLVLNNIRSKKDKTEHAENNMQVSNHEAYVSLEVAKLLKKAGFDWKCNHYYFTQNGKTESKSDFRHPAQNYNESMTTTDSKSFEFEVCSRPTLDVAQRWLREVKNMLVEVCFGQERKWNYTAVFDMSIEGIVPYDKMFYKKGFWSYEETQEAGIKKVLEIILEK